VPSGFFQFHQGRETTHLPLGDEGSRGQIEHQAAIHFRVKTKVKVIERVMRVAEGSLFPAALNQPLAAPIQLVSNQARD
jgi:hypothetical protein